jgi:hypothetical protein
MARRILKELFSAQGMARRTNADAPGFRSLSPRKRENAKEKHLLESAQDCPRVSGPEPPSGGTCDSYCKGRAMAFMKLKILLPSNEKARRSPSEPPGQGTCACGC